MWEFETNDSFALTAANDYQFIPDLIKETVSPAISQKLKLLLLRMLHPGTLSVSPFLYIPHYFSLHLRILSDPLRRVTVSDILKKKWLIRNRDLVKAKHQLTFGEARCAGNASDDDDDDESVQSIYTTPSLSGDDVVEERRPVTEPSIEPTREPAFAYRKVHKSLKRRNQQKNKSIP